MYRSRLYQLAAAMLVGILVLPLFFGGGPAEAVVSDTTLAVGVPSLTGSFLKGFERSEADVAVQKLLYGYETFSVTPTGDIVQNNTVVRQLLTETDASGNRVYTIVLHEDLQWSNGNPVTASDYVFSLLLHASPAWKQAGGHTDIGRGLLGYQDYHSGKSPVFAGVRLLGTYRFSLIIDRAYLPTFWERAYVATTPVPMDIWSRQASVESGGDGSKIVGMSLTDLIARVVQFYLSGPIVFSGPYKLMNYANGEATLARNERFKGTYNGKKPTLDFISIKSFPESGAVDRVLWGELHLAAGIRDLAAVRKARSSVAATSIALPDKGFQGLLFHSDLAPVNNAEVRQAIAYLLDEGSILSALAAQHGSAVPGYYFPWQWMAQSGKSQLQAMYQYQRNVARANQLLDQTQWIYESNGTTRFDPAKASSRNTYLRHNNRGEVLTIRHLDVLDDAFGAALTAQLAASLPLAGIGFDYDRVDAQTHSDRLHYPRAAGSAPRQYHTFTYSHSFTTDFNPYAELHTDSFGTPGNVAQLRNTDMDAAIGRLRAIQPGQNSSYLTAWLGFQQAFADLMPIIPVYTPASYDVASNWVSGVATTPYASWADIICDIGVKVPDPLYIVVGQTGYTIGGVRKDMAASYYKGRDTMMPVRLLEEFGMEMEWNQSTATAILRYRGNTIELTIGSTYAIVNGLRSSIIGASGEMIAPELAPGRTMIPLRFVSENLGFKVHWDPSNTITIWP